VTLALIACSSRQGAEGAVSVSAPVPPVVTLERAPCLGTCPVYQLSIFGDGTVRFDGKQHVAQQGVATAKISSGAVDSLVSELESAGYFGFADEYVRDAPACGQYATDSPSVITSLTVNGRTKRIRHDYGCGAAPPELGRLEQRIDEVAGTSRWIGR
jgi:hypothetical protein